MTAVPVLSVRNVHKGYGPVPALSGASFDVMGGEIFGLLGSNGSGKSTLLKIAATLLTPDDGSVEYFGRRGLPNRSEILSRIGVLFDHASHWDHLTGYENAWFFARSYGMTQPRLRERLDTLFHRLDLYGRRNDPVSTYSFGMRRKLSLIEAMAHHPALLLLDEPSIGLDYAADVAFRELLLEEAGQGTAVLLSTNDVHEAATLAHRIALLAEGKIVVCGEPSDLIRSVRTGTRIDLRLAGAVPLSTLENVSGVRRVQIVEGEEGAFHAVVLAERDGADTGALLADLVRSANSLGGRILGIEVSEPDLGDVFLQYIPEANDVP